MAEDIRVASESLRWMLMTWNLDTFNHRPQETDGQAGDMVLSATDVIWRQQQQQQQVLHEKLCLLTAIPNPSHTATTIAQDRHKQSRHH